MTPKLATSFNKEPVLPIDFKYHTYFELHKFGFIFQSHFIFKAIGSELVKFFLLN